MRHSRGVLPYIFEFQRLKHRRDSGAEMTAQEEWRLEVLVEEFEPWRITSSGLVREPRWLASDCEALVTFGECTLRARASELSLREVRVVAVGMPQVGDSVRLALEGTGLCVQVWFRFCGYICSAGPGNAATVRLGKPLGAQLLLDGTDCASADELMAGAMKVHQQPHSAAH